MSSLTVEQFWGRTTQKITFDGFTVTENEYNTRFIDWHYHEKPYFSFITSGNCQVLNKRETLDYSLGSLRFHNCQELHAKAESKEMSRHFQLELDLIWCKKFEINLNKFPISTKILNPSIKLNFYHIYKEAKLPDDASNLTIDALLLQVFETMQGTTEKIFATKPRWVKKLDEILHDKFNSSLNLQDLSSELDIHPVHLSRHFSRYFQGNFSQYIRKIRLEKSINLLHQKNLSLTEIAHQCGFADQSHFIRNFKEHFRITPRKYRQIIS